MIQPFPCTSLISRKPERRLGVPVSAGSGRIVYSADGTSHQRFEPSSYILHAAAKFIRYLASLFSKSINLLWHAYWW